MSYEKCLDGVTSRGVRCDRRDDAVGLSSGRLVASADEIGARRDFGWRKCISARSGSWGRKSKICAGGKKVTYEIDARAIRRGQGERVYEEWVTCCATGEQEGAGAARLTAAERERMV